MRDIIRVTIKSESGYGCIDDAYSEKITITPSSVSYEYKPAIESEFHAFRKWSYKTNSSLFLELFMKISSRFCLNAFTFFIFVFAFCVFDRKING